MGRLKEIAEKYGLNNPCIVNDVPGLKMDSDCLRRFAEGDPSGNLKYLDWMIFQAGGGTQKFERSVSQWEKGDHGEQPVKGTLREKYLADAVTGYIDDDDKPVAPVSHDEAVKAWDEKDGDFYRRMHLYGDEEYALTGFGFYRSWPGKDSLYEQIVQAVSRFHRYRTKLVSLKKSVDLSVASYPNFRDLLEVLSDITYLEVKNDADYDLVFENDHITVICPFNVGASMKFGHQKWCTANESMFKAAVAENGPNRWKEYAKESALYYVTIKSSVAIAGEGTELAQIAIQAPFSKKASVWKLYDTNDTGRSESEMVGMICEAFGAGVEGSLNRALSACRAHLKTYPKSRLNLEFVVRK